MLDTRKIQYFVSAAKYLSFTLAAEENYTTQPTISKQIAQLEEELGVDLFIRRTREISLTTAGEHLLPYCTEILRITAAAQEEMKEFAEQTEGTSFTLGLQVDIPYDANIAVFQASRRIRTKYPALSFSFHSKASGTLDDLLHGSVDAAILTRPISERTDNRLHAVQLFKTELYLLWGGQLSETDNGDIENVLKSRTIIFFRDTALSAHIKKLLDTYNTPYSCEDRNFNPAILGELANNTKYAIVYALSEINEFTDLLASSDISYAEFHREEACLSTDYVYTTTNKNPFIRRILRELE